MFLPYPVGDAMDFPPFANRKRTLAMSPLWYSLVCTAQFVVGIHKPPEGGDVYELLFFRYDRVCTAFIVALLTYIDRKKK